jgi:hypothetical protein
MIMPLVNEIIGLLLEGIQQDRDGSASYQMTAIMQGVINSFVCVEEYKQKMQQQVNHWHTISHIFVGNIFDLYIQLI